MNLQALLNLEEVVKKPAMYLPSRSIYCLKAFVDGVNCKNQTDVWDYMDGFYDWLLDTFNHSNNAAQDEIKLVLHYMSNDPHDAFDRFFELFQEFHQGEELLPLFQDLKSNPYKYLPNRTINSLYAYFWGKDMASQGGIKSIDLSEFENWLQNQFENDSSWYKVILLYSHDEFGALQQFQTLYSEFKSMPSHASDTASM